MSRSWAGYAAGAWALLFAAANVYWGLGGRQAIPVADPAAAFGDVSFVMLNWAAVVLKAGIGLLALATVRTRARGLPRRLLLFAAYGLGVGMALYGALGLVVDGLRLHGVLAVPPSAWPALRWHVFLWDPWWVTGGALFVGAARDFQQRTRGA